MQNFTLVGAPSSICSSCLEFLIDYESRKIRYAKAEQIFMELLKMRNKAVDVDSVRLKHGLIDAGGEKQTEVTQDRQEYFEHVIEEVLPEAPITDAPDQQLRLDRVEVKSKQISHKQEKVADQKTRISRRTFKKETIAPLPKPRPKLLNPTIHPKISNINRLELFNCDRCLHNCSTKTAMERHMKQIHLKPSSTSFRCETCLKTFAKKIILQNHEKVHMTHRPTYECQICKKVLSSQTAVSNHMQWIHKKNREFKCRFCSKMFATVGIILSKLEFKLIISSCSQKGSFNEHEKIHSDIKTHGCPICKKSYKTASTLSQHLDTHGTTEYHCPECFARLNSKRTLRQHMLKHSDVVRHTCEYCNAQFKRTKGYKEHLISVHTKIRAYNCEFCSKTFSNGANCRKHKKESHPSELEKADKKKEKPVVKLPNIKEILTISQENIATSELSRLSPKHLSGI